MKCCGHEMESIGLRIIDGFEEEIFECAICDRRTDRDNSKFEGGVLRADALPDRFVSHVEQMSHKDIDSESNAVYGRYASMAERDEKRRMNLMCAEVAVCKKHGFDIAIGKTREQRRAELEVMLERRLD